MGINQYQVSISAGNRKMGAIPSVSLPPIATCPKNAPCAKKCYAKRLCNRRKNVRESYLRNLHILESDSNSYWMQVKGAACMTRYFRYHVSGDIPNMEYLNNMVETACSLSGTKFLCFTKQYFAVNTWLDNNGGEFPSNLQVIFSHWDDEWNKTIINKYNLPTAKIIFEGQEPQDDWKVCGGNCADCICRGVGCWELKKGETIAFYEH